MNAPIMQFHESYGALPTTTLRLVRKHNVSPADFDHIIDVLKIPTWNELEQHIIDHSPMGYYQPRFF